MVVSQNKTMVLPFPLALVTYPLESVNEKSILYFLPGKRFYLGPAGIFSRKSKLYGCVFERGNLTILLKSNFLKC